MNINQITITSMPAQPLTPCELVSDDMLRTLARIDESRAVGEISAEDQSILAMYLPDICGELIARRAAMRSEDGGAPFTDPHNHAEEIANARAGFFTPPKDGVPV
ncbi:hypothetical protein [Sulfitobacter pacificus]|uniref:Uncharacterized protein n=1 Tax=Sulfitobacter pacificus TaxID=1499314 RepID=A0ABQ5VG97_9RHOB|nr:hypothetical protein [Sulfitobacter pacificus]GLQ26110.1 hypothetical protein GCM10007927_09130 [Sulfitobacter pacificus]